jgi:putative transposase
LERIEEAPHRTLEELRDELKARGVIVGHGTVWRFFEREDITFKKKRAGGRARAA